MSDNKNSAANKPSNDGNESAAVPTAEAATSNAELQSTKSLIDMANTTFKSLCETLEMEQQKLLDLEQRRKMLEIEMEKLKVEIDEEKKIYNEQLDTPMSEELQKFVTQLRIDDDSSNNLTEEHDEIDDDDTSLEELIDASEANKSASLDGGDDDDDKKATSIEK